MEFVPHPIFPSQLILGPRVAPGAADLTDPSQVQRVLTAIVKGTFMADDPSATPRPSDTLLNTDELFSDPDAAVRREHDMAVFKPRADIVVLGAPAPPEPGPVGDTWTERVALGGDAMSQNFGPAVPELRWTFGWESRTVGTRLGYAGEAETFNPEVMGLPRHFQNLFFNGGSYRGGAQPAFAHPGAGATVTLETTAAYVEGTETVTRTLRRQLHLPASAPEAQLTFRTGGAAEAPIETVTLAMNADTVVYNKAPAQFTVVWRGVWEYDRVAADRYVRLRLS